MSNKTKIAIIFFCFLTAGNIDAQASSITSNVKSFCHELIVSLQEQQAGYIPIAIIDFENQSEKARQYNVGFAVSELLTEEFAGSEYFMVVERKQIHKILETVELQLSGLYDPEKVVSVGRLIGAEYILLGSVSELAGKYRIAARVVEMETGNIMLARSLELPGELVETVSKRYLPPRYRLASGAAYMYVPEQEHFESVIGPSLSFSYDVGLHHSLCLGINMYFTFPDDRSYYYLNQQYSIPTPLFLYAGFAIYNTLDVALGYGYRIPVTKILMIRPALYMGGTLKHYSYEHGIQDYGAAYFDEDTTSESFGTLFVNPEISFYIDYSNPISLFLSLGYYQPLSRLKDSWSYAGIDVSYQAMFNSFQCRAGISMYF